jgi:FlaA1/EpsC-like NDP-sugar epimerase
MVNSRVDKKSSITVHVTYRQTKQTTFSLCGEITRPSPSTTPLPPLTMHFLRPSIQSKSISTIQTLKRTFTQSSRLRNATDNRRQFAGKHCIITGASRGIGAEIARHFAREGARCLLIGRNESLLGHVKEELEKAEGGEHRVLVGDVGNGEFWALLKKEVSLVLYF